MAAKKTSPHREMLAARRRRDAEILRRYKKKETMQEIADHMGMTRQRVGQIIREAQAKQA